MIIEQLMEVTEENKRIVQRTLDCRNNYYEVLNVSKFSDSFEKELKYAYKRLSLKLHPDKNRAPGAEKAFKVVKHFFICIYLSYITE